ncbi:MAG: NAD regulator [Caulobacteraceae bacterium]|nr:NAD regulator [Caulobacter sp.]
MNRVGGERIAIGLSAVVMAVRDGEACALTVAAPGQPAALPSGPFAPAAHRTFELALRAFVTAQTGFELGYVEQLYTFGDEGRDAPLADLGDGAAPAEERVVSVGYLALTPAGGGELPGAVWMPWTHVFPWEDWRGGRPEALRALEPRLRAWAARPGELGARRLARARALFALDGARWNDERVLDRYELLYEAGLVQEAGRDRERAAGHAGAPLAPRGAGAPMTSDHRRILATGLGRLRGKLRYRPVAFELLGAAFTLYDLQRAVEAVSGLSLHKPNFRRMVERTGLIEGLGRVDRGAGGRPAELFRYRRELAAAGSVGGFGLPALLREG